MTRHGSGIGVSAFALYVPPYRVDLQAWCEWTHSPWEKIRDVVGRSFRIPGPDESIYTMAANAVLRLIIAGGVDPGRVGFLGFGTESSTDNSAGAVILKGMVDRALEQLGRPRLARACEVPEFKHACLGGVYALKSALRFVACGDPGQQAIVVSADVAEYPRGSSGEPTQGAGAVAQLVEADPALYTVDLRRSGSASDYRGADFRKPMIRHFLTGRLGAAGRMNDFPVFTGKYSTTCYVDEVFHALDDLLARIGTEARTFYHEIEGAFFHRPYRRMPVNAMAALYIRGLARHPEHRDELETLCREAGVDPSVVVAESFSEPDLFGQALRGRFDEEVYPASMEVVRRFRSTAKFEEVVQRKMTLGADFMLDLGNLYTASLPAWIGAGLEEAADRGLELAEREFVAIGYGSGDAAEAHTFRVVPGWELAAARLRFRAALEGGIDLDRNQYEALHDRRELVGIDHAPRGFLVERIGESLDGGLQDLGVEYYRFIPEEFQIDDRR